MFWITNALTVATILAAVACTWHFACFSAQDLASRRLRKRFPHVKFA